MTPLYPTRQQITTPNIEGAIADAIARKLAAGITMRPAAIGDIRLKAKARTDIVDRMANQMLDFGEGMSKADLHRIYGWSFQIIDICADDANALARQRANMN